MVDAGPDQVACEMGESVELSGSVFGNYSMISWSPPGGLTSTNSSSTQALVTGSATYTLTAEGLSTVNSIINGNFEGGTGGFITGYIPFNFTFPTEGQYYLTNNPLAFIGPLSSCVDHTTGSGNMFLVDGATSSGVSVWCQTLTVNPNTDYIFSAWFITHFISPPVIQISYNNVPSPTAYTLPATLCNWYEVTETWNSGPNTSLTICIENLNTSALGNDFAIDDISLFEMCKVSDDVEVSLSTLETNILPYGQISCDNPEIMISGLGSSSGPGITYSWTTSNGIIISGAFTTDILVGSAGTYTFEISGPNGCTREIDVEVTGSTDPPDLEVLGAELMCGDSTVQITATSMIPGVTFDWEGPAGFNSNLSDPWVAQSGTYYVTITAPNGCTAEDMVTVIGDSNTPVISIAGGPVSCIDPNPQLVASSTIANVSFVWNGPNGFTSSIEDPIVSDTGLYNLSVETITGCVVLDSIYISGYNSNPNVGITADTLTCEKDTVNLLTSVDQMNVNYVWAGPGGISGSTASLEIVESGWYYLTVSSSPGCITVDSQFVESEMNLPLLQLTGDTVTCNSPVAELRVGTDADIISWNYNMLEISQDSSIMAVNAGWYFVDVESSNGCTSRDSFLLLVDTLATNVSISIDTLDCNQPGSIPNVVTSTAVQSVVWSGPGNFNAAILAPPIDIPGFYTVEWNGENGCVDSIQFEVIGDFDLPTSNAQGDTLNCGENLEQLFANATGLGLTYEWSGPSGFNSTNADPIVVETGAYVLTVTGENGCAAIDTAFIIPDDELPVISLSWDTITCSNPEATIISNSDIANSTFNWSGPNGFVSMNATIQTTTDGSYQLTVMAPNGCEAQAIVDIELDTLAPSIVLQPVDTIDCSESSIAIQPITIDNTLSYTWTDGNGVLGNNPTITIDSAGIYTLTAVGENGCDASTQVEVLMLGELPNLTLATGTLTCQNTEVEISAISDVTGSTISWTGPNTFTSIEEINIVAQSGTYAYTVTSPGGCEVQGELMVLEDMTVPQLTGQDTMIRCWEASVALKPVLLNPGDMFMYSWTDESGSPIGSLNSVQVSQSGLYNLEIENPVNGCDTTIAFLVSDDPGLISNVEFTFSQPDCNSANGTFQVLSIDGYNSGAMLAIDKIPVTNTFGLVNDLTSGNYVFEVSNDANCSWWGMFEIDPVSNFDLQLEDTVLAQTGQTVALSPQLIGIDAGAVSVQWSPAGLVNCPECLETTSNVSTPTWFFIEVSDSLGCVRQDSIFVQFLTAGEVYLPNIFSPHNLDGVNDLFFPMTEPNPGQRVEVFRIFNRWGGLVFENADFLPNEPGEGWNGKVGSKLAPSGVYAHYLLFETVDGRSVVLSGDVTLIR